MSDANTCIKHCAVIEFFAEEETMLASIHEHNTQMLHTHLLYTHGVSVLLCASVEIYAPLLKHGKESLENSSQGSHSVVVATDGMCCKMEDKAM